MKKRQCDLCDYEISTGQGVSFGSYDLCGPCVTIVRCAVCRKCHGKGAIRVRDDRATSAQATCGENRTQYKNIPCKDCE